MGPVLRARVCLVSKRFADVFVRRVLDAVGNRVVAACSSRKALVRTKRLRKCTRPSFPTMSKRRINPTMRFCQARIIFASGNVCARAHAHAR